MNGRPGCGTPYHGDALPGSRGKGIARSQEPDPSSQKSLGLSLGSTGTLVVRMEVAARGPVVAFRTENVSLV